MDYEQVVAIRKEIGDIGKRVAETHGRDHKFVVQLRELWKMADEIIRNWERNAS